MHSGWGFGSGAKGCGKCSSVARVFFFYSGNLAKVNRMSTAHMQGEHLIKGTHTRRKKHTERSCCGEVLPGRSCWLSETRAIRDLGQALNSRANLHDFTVLLYCLDFHHRKNRNSESFSKSYIYISTTYTYTRVDQIRLGQTDDWFCKLAKPKTSHWRRLASFVCAILIIRRLATSAIDATYINPQAQSKLLRHSRPATPWKRVP